MEYYAAIEYCLVFLKHKEMFLKWKKKNHTTHIVGPQFWNNNNNFEIYL